MTHAKPISFQFCLRLPQYVYDTSTKSAALVSTSAPQTAPSTSGGTSLSQSFLSVASPPATPQASPPPPPATRFSSPKMKLFAQSSTKSNNSKKGYYGDMTFLDNDANFTKTFGDHPTMLPEKPLDSNHVTVHQKIHAYAELCKLDIFMHLCKLDYVGADNVDPGLNVVEVCRQISSLKQIWNENSSIHTDTPDELYDKFTRLAVSLPTDATKWSIQLCSSYLASSP